MLCRVCASRRHVQLSSTLRAIGILNARKRQITARLLVKASLTVPIPITLYLRFPGHDEPCKQFINFHSHALTRTSNLAWLWKRSSLEEQPFFPFSRLKVLAKFAIFLQRLSAEYQKQSLVAITKEIYLLILIEYITLGRCRQYLNVAVASLFQLIKKSSLA